MSADLDGQGGAVDAQAWADVLDRLQGELEAAEAVLLADEPGDAVGPTTWRAPAGLGPMPVEHAERARALLARQGVLTEHLTAAAALTRRHLVAASALDARPPGVPVYLDVEG
ncbi:hypothetical protein ACGIF2_07170 [Cellulomonas sp. P22]|uniref:hypothetical protein n=1 Tax=Cellulomonas sp. P22 TaxID=3373189 RepID=UPI0037BA5D5E